MRHLNVDLFSLNQNTGHQMMSFNLGTHAFQFCVKLLTTFDNFSYRFFSDSCQMWGHPSQLVNFNFFYFFISFPVFPPFRTINTFDNSQFSEYFDLVRYSLPWYFDLHPLSSQGPIINYELGAHFSLKCLLTHFSQAGFQPSFSILIKCFIA